MTSWQQQQFFGCPNICCCCRNRPFFDMVRNSKKCEKSFLKLKKGLLWQQQQQISGQEEICCCCCHNIPFFLIWSEIQKSAKIRFWNSKKVYYDNNKFLPVQIFVVVIMNLLIWSEIEKNWYGQKLEKIWYSQKLALSENWQKLKKFDMVRNWKNNKKKWTTRQDTTNFWN